MDSNSFDSRIAKLSTAKRARLELRLKQRSGSDSAHQYISRREASDSSPLSFAQQRLWFLHQLEPTNAAYNESRAIRLTGTLDLDALQRALNQIVARHEVLRTTFVPVDGIAMQVISKRGPVELPVVDLRSLPGPTKEPEICRLLAEVSRRPFDLSKDLMLRALLLWLDQGEHILSLTAHHIAFDGWSGAVLAQELTALYDAFVSGQPPTLPDLPIQYADYAVWQRDWLQGELLDTQLAYWKKQLDGLVPLQIPTDRVPPVLETYDGAKQSLVIAEELSDQLRAFSRRRGVSLFMTLLAAFQTLLYRYSGKTDVAVGTPFAGRSWPETENLIGFFVNTLVMRSDLSGTPTCNELLERVREVTLNAYTHQDMPFEKLVQELNPQRNLATTPLFQVIFALQNVPRLAMELPGLAVSPVDVESGMAKFDLFLAIIEQDRQLTAKAVYKTDLFDPSTVTRMLRHFEILLKTMVANPEQRISELAILTEAERRQLLVEWSGTEKDYSKDKCIHELFEEQVEKTPDAIAIVFEQRRISYRELNRRANQVAHYLRKQGVGAETLVALGMKRSIEMIIGQLGVLKAGAAYVPLDPEYPRERLAFILQDTRAAALLTQGRLIEEMVEDGEPKVEDRPPSSILHPRLKATYLDRDWEAIAQESSENPSSGTSGENLAYVIYTSGSTGRPKGVMIEHRNATAFLAWATSAFSTEDLSAVLASTSICFDLSIFEIFAPLTVGGKVILAESILALPELPDREEVTLINTVPSAIAELVRKRCVPDSVRVVNLAGEPLKNSLVRKLYETTQAEKIHDLYGPTETTTYSTWGQRAVDGAQTIGRPIANTQIYLLDERLQPVPVGVRGEIYIGGAGVTRGYLNDPELTGQKFIPNPFSTDRQARLYKTGDLARYLPDGNIELLGRVDNQVKIRGYRIELGEIEAVLGQHPGIRETLILTREDNSGEQQIVAYVVPQQRAPTIGELRSYLRTKLPEYMVPAAFVVLDSFPLTPNGKIDRRALPVRDRRRPESEPSFVAPRTDLEERLAQIWREVLKVERVGIHDNFFDLGGHSLLVMRVIARVRQSLATELPVRAIFETPTIGGLAAVIAADRAKAVHKGNVEPLLSEVETMSDEEAGQQLIEETK